jgi:hypothetical protein
LWVPTVSGPTNTESEEENLGLIPYNHATRKMIILVPYNNTGPLDPNYLSFVTTLGNTNKEYYLKNSERKLVIDFDIQAVQVSASAYDGSGFFPNAEADEIIFESDPLIDYSKYDFAIVAVLNDSWDSGGAGIKYDFVTQKPGIFQTNEPIAGIMVTDYFNSSGGSPTPYQQSIFQHEIGHILTYWAPTFDYSHYLGLIPHANGIHFPSCALTPDAICYSKEYGNHFDVMGLGHGLFNQHTAVFRAGLRSASSVRTITESGIYELCSINNEATSDNCPQELLIKNLKGLDMALELRSPKSPESLLITADGCPANQLEGLIIYGANPEQGAKFGQIKTHAFGETALSFIEDKITCSSGKSIYQYTLLVGSYLITDLAEIQLISIMTTNPTNGDRKARVFIQYSPPVCDTSSPGVMSTHASAIGCPTMLPPFGT